MPLRTRGESQVRLPRAPSSWFCSSSRRARVILINAPQEPLFRLLQDYVLRLRWDPFLHGIDGGSGAGQGHLPLFFYQPLAFFARHPRPDHSARLYCATCSPKDAPPQNGTCQAPALVVIGVIP